MVKVYPKGSPELLSDNFRAREFDCKCDECEVTYIDTDLVCYLQQKRREIGEPFVLNSAFRCTSHNQAVDGKPGSQHLQGKAVDITIPGQDMVAIAEEFEDADGLGRYPGRHFIHVDVRGYKARWEG